MVTIKITWENETTGETVTTLESVYMLDGLRHGTSVYRDRNGDTKYLSYDMGNYTGPASTKNTYISQTDISAFQVLMDRYPWFLFALNSFGYEDEYVEAYIDTVESMLYANVFELEVHFCNL